MEKKYTYIYCNNVSSRFFTEQGVINHITSSPFPKDRYSIVELVPVKMIPQPGFKLERE